MPWGPSLATAGPVTPNERTSTIFFLSFFFSSLHFENREQGVSVPSSGGGACLVFSALNTVKGFTSQRDSQDAPLVLGCLAGLAAAGT